MNTIPVPSWWPSRARQIVIEPPAAPSTSPLTKAEALAPPVLPIPLSRAQAATAWPLLDYAVVPAGDIVATQGRLARQALIIASGSAAATREGERTALLGPGQTIGLKSVLDDHPQSSTVHAVTDLQVLAMTPPQVAALLSAVPPLARALFRTALRAPA